MLFVCYPKCSTCMKAKKWLEENGKEYSDQVEPCGPSSMAMPAAFSALRIASARAKSLDLRASCGMNAGRRGSAQPRGWRGSTVLARDASLWILSVRARVTFCVSPAGNNSPCTAWGARRCNCIVDSASLIVFSL